MVSYYKHNEIDKSLWDKCVSSSGTDLIYPYSWYLDVVCPDWGAIIFMSEGKYGAVMPVPLRKKFALKYAFQPVFTQQLGIFQKETEEAEKVEKQMFGLLLSKFKWVESCIGHPIHLDDSKLSMGERKTYVLDLQEEYKAIYRSYTTNRKRNLKRSKELGVVIKEVNAVDEFIKFFIDQKGDEIRDVNFNDYRVLERLYSKLKPMNKIQLLQAVNMEEKAVGYAMILDHADRLIFLLGTANSEGRKIGVMTQLLDSVILKNAGSQKKLDFEGSSIDSIAKFYSSFGGKPEKFWYLRYNNLPFPYNFFKK